MCGGGVKQANNDCQPLGVPKCVQDLDVRSWHYACEIFQIGRNEPSEPEDELTIHAAVLPVEGDPDFAGETKRLPRLGSAVVVLSEGMILLGARAKDPNRGKWVLPGGKIEPFESINEAARREIQEETGLEIEVERQLGVWEIINPPDEHRVIVYSVARPVGGALRPATDLSDVAFYPVAALESLDLSDTVRAVLGRFLPCEDGRAA